MTETTPKTAAQINLPQTGQVTTKPTAAGAKSKVPAKPAPIKFKAPVAAVPVTNGWHVNELKLPKSEMLEAVAGLQTIPSEAKAFIAALVNSIPASAGFLVLHAHCNNFQTAKGSSLNLSLTLSPL